MASFKRILLCCDASREGKELALECRAQTHLLAALDEAPLPWRGLRNGRSGHFDSGIVERGSRGED